MEVRRRVSADPRRAAFHAALLAAAAQAAAASDPRRPLLHSDLQALQRETVRAMRVAEEATAFPRAVPRVRLVVVGRQAWARRTAEDYLPVLDAAYAALVVAEASEESAEGADGGTSLAGRMRSAAERVHPQGGAGLLGTVIGMLVGQLAQRTLGEFELPIPRDHPQEVTVLAENLAGFTGEWGLEAAQARPVLLTADAVRRVILQQPHVRDRLMALLDEHARLFGFDPERFVAGVSAAQRSTTVAELRATIRTPEQEGASTRLSAIGSVLSVYAEHVALTSVGGAPRLAEALERRRAEMPLRDRLIEMWFGLELDDPAHRRARALLDAVVSARGSAALAQIWHGANTLPAPEDLDEPGRLIRRLQTSSGPPQVVRAEHRAGADGDEPQAP
jgi:putative hydrolase